MDVAVNSKRNKVLYKIFLIVLKYLPIIVTVFYILNTVLCWFNIDCSLLSNISGISIISWIFIYIATYVFQFCNYHRLLLHYILIDDLISIYDYYFIIPLSDYYVLSIHTSLIGILALILLVEHVKSNKKFIREGN